MTVSIARPAIDQWPDLAAVPRGLRTTVSAAVARRIFLAGVRRLPVTVHLGDETLGTGGPAMTVHRPEEFFARLGRGVLIGFGEAYLTGAWDAPDLGAFLSVLAAEMPTLVPPSLQRLRALAVLRPPHHQKSTTANSQNNIAHHYDLSNGLFELFLDPGLSYSSALFEAERVHDDGFTRATDPVPGSDLAEGQWRKIERLLDHTDVRSGSRVLEIGTGWGELAIAAARRGAVVHSITLSTEQKELAERRIADAGLSDRVTVELLDYRDLVAVGSPHFGAYDAVLSVEMIEAVGFDFWEEYFGTLDAVLAPGGAVGIQAITMRHDRMLATRNTYTWINKYIFPGGFLPSVDVIDQITRDHTRLRVTDRLSFGRHYAETLRQWDTRFLAAREQVLALGFDETFIRMWHFYLEYSLAGFASDYIDVNQIVMRQETGS
ncbi:SAM-dependent methyltransferase [Nocardioides cynanchi]|uniref:SAM-dependent methyltransferase n=1 Tax=Nocardioides cynanchi TaxID=2558918 RepID=UPI00124522F2|nr:cyclopropane-fatty-acyl-phospholipid synthase family protein [Nocardioides cynanchi]